MKTVGQQLQEARLAKNWTPELAARETKIRVERLRDLEADDFTHFSSPAYARGFVRTYARALGVDERRMLRQLDTKLADEDNATFINDSGVTYVPKSPKRPRASAREDAVFYLFIFLGLAIFGIIAYVLVQAYRVGDLSRYFAKSSPAEQAPVPTNTATAENGEASSRALPVEPVNDTNAPVSGAPRALPVEPGATDETTAAVVAAATPPPPAPVATPVPSGPAPRALPVDPSELTGAAPAASGPAPVPVSTPAPAPAEEPAHPAPRALPVDPSELTGAAPAAAPEAVNTPASIARAASVPAAPGHASHLLLSASTDSFVRVTDLDDPAPRIVYDSVLRGGQSISFDGRRFSLNVANPSAVSVSLDGADYPHRGGYAPQTFTVEAHQP